MVFSDTELLNDTGLRFPDECVRHKILDLIGDLALLGLPVIGHFIANRAGHQLHAELVTAILDNPDSWILLNSEGEGKDSISSSAVPTSQVPSLPTIQPALSSS